MNLGELFIELGVVGDVKPLKDALKTLKQAESVANRDIKLNKLKLKLIKDVTNATTKEEKSLLSATYVQERRNILQSEDIEKTQDAIKGKESLAKSVAGTTTKVAGFITAVAGSIIVVDKMVNNLIRANQTWVNFTRQTDLSLKSLQKYSGVASLLDKSLGMEGAAGSIEQLNKRLFELRLTGEGARGFQLAGVNPIGQDAFGVIEQLRSRFQGMDNTTATYLMEQMGLDPKLLPLIRMTRKEFEDLYNSVKDYQLTAQQREEIQKMNIQLEIAATKFRYLKDRAILAIMPAFTKFMTSLARITEMIARFIVKYKEIIGVSALLLSRLKPVQALFSKISGVIASLISQIPIVGRLLVGLGSIFSRLLLPITAIYLLLDDIAVFMEGGDSVIGMLLNYSEAFIKDLINVFEGFTNGNPLAPLIKSLVDFGNLNIPIPPIIQSIIAAASAMGVIVQNMSDLKNQGIITGGAASLGYAGALPDLSSSFITPSMQRNISNNSVTNNYDNRQINQSNSIMTNQTVDSLQHELVFARNSMNAGFA